jgi:large subunit ribosomal protein L29
MKIDDARAMTNDEIEDKILELKKEQFNLRFQKATGQLANTARVRIVRRDIAQLMTIVREKKLGKAGSAATASGAKAKPKTKAKRK